MPEWFFVCKIKTNIFDVKANVLAQSGLWTDQFCVLSLCGASLASRRGCLQPCNQQKVRSFDVVIIFAPKYPCRFLTNIT